PLLVRRDLFTALGGFAADRLGMEDADLLLRAWERLGDGGIGHVADVLLHRREDGGHATVPLADLLAAGRRSVGAHLARQAIAAEVVDGFLPLARRVCYRHDGEALVSIIVVARDGAADLQRCVDSLFAKTAYGAFELLVLDANSADAGTREFVRGLETLADPRVRAYRLEREGSLAALSNLMAEQAAGDYLLFLDADACVIDGQWLGTMMAHARRPEVGAVGPRLLDADGTVRQAGLILGIGGGIGSAFAGIKFDDPGYFGRALLEQSVAAVGGGAFLVRKDLFGALGGFDVGLAPEAAETDLCLRLGDAGRRIVWTPHASLLCPGRARRKGWGEGASEEAAEQLQERWLLRLAADPHYNANLKKSAGEVFVIEERAALNWDPLPWRPLPRIIAHPADNMGCGQYRVLGPMRSLAAAGRIQGWTTFAAFAPLEVAAMAPDTLVLQRYITDEQIAAVARYRKFKQAFRVFELDDLLLRLPGRSAHRQHMPQDITERLRRAFPLCQRLVVSTEPLAEAYRGYNDDVRVVGNYLERSRWGDLRPSRRQAARPRVGWVGGVGHTGDLEMIADVVRDLEQEVDWIFMGMCPDGLRPFVREYHAGIPFERYPAAMASLNLDLAVAPLEINPFNEAKSSLRLLEYGVLGYPVVCSDIFPYQGDFPVTRVRNRTQDWVAAIREKLADLDALAEEGDALRDFIQANWMLEDHLDVWLAAWLP
ncbi:MAG TPA: glycosyltransferase, partial [Rhodocyclaceae bacterium]|nr:glycosyltransferase [Rhodocyclaceae bacterium]